MNLRTVSNSRARMLVKIVCKKWFQFELYQWLLRQIGFEVPSTPYFFYANGIKGDGHFNDDLNFTTQLILFEWNDAKIEPALLEINELLKSHVPPAVTKDCKQCEYVEKALNIFILLHLQFSVFICFKMPSAEPRPPFHSD